MIRFQIQERYKKEFFNYEKEFIQEAVYTGKNGVTFKATLFQKKEVLGVQLKPTSSDIIANDTDVIEFLMELQEALKTEVTMIMVDSIKKCKVRFQYKTSELSVPFTKSHLADIIGL